MNKRVDRGRRGFSGVLGESFCSLAGGESHAMDESRDRRERWHEPGEERGVAKLMSQPCRQTDRLQWLISKDQVWTDY